MWNQLWIPGINSAWSWCTILFICCWICFWGILLCRLLWGFFVFCFLVKKILRISFSSGVSFGNLQFPSNFCISSKLPDLLTQSYSEYIVFPSFLPGLGSDVSSFISDMGYLCHLSFFGWKVSLVKSWILLKLSNNLFFGLMYFSVLLLLLLNWFILESLLFPLSCFLRAEFALLFLISSIGRLDYWFFYFFMT